MTAVANTRAFKYSAETGRGNGMQTSWQECQCAPQPRGCPGQGVLLGRASLWAEHGVGKCWRELSAPAVKINKDWLLPSVSVCCNLFAFRKDWIPLCAHRAGRIGHRLEHLFPSLAWRTWLTSIFLVYLMSVSVPCWNKISSFKIFSKAYFSVNLFLELLFLGSCVDLVGGVI